MTGYRRRRGAAASQRADPFALLGLRPASDLTDDEVRAAWRRVAAATHPDRADGGDPARFAGAAAAYTELRTAYGRNEARAAPGGTAGHSGGRGARLRELGLGRPWRLLLRVAAAVLAAVLGVLAAGHSPAAPALVAGALTWLLLTARRDLRG